MADTPTFPEAIAQAIDARIADIRGPMPARVVEYFPVGQFATVEPVTWLGGERAPLLDSIPVMWPHGGDEYLVFKLEEGDTGLLIPCDSDIANWRRTGEAGAPLDAARHHLANSVFFPGLEPNNVNLTQPASGGVLAGDLKLGTSAATEALLRGTQFTTDLNTYMLAVQSFCTTAAAAVPALGPACTALSTAAGALILALPGHLSTKVEVD